MLESICRKFLIEGEYRGFYELKDGIINKSYKVIFFRDGEDKEYVLQKINRNVFENPEKIMENIIGITKHIRASIKSTGVSAKREVLHYCFTKDENSLYVDENGDYWRCYRFIDNSIVFNSSDDLSIIENVGKAFGAFQLNLSDYDASSLFESIPNFHNTKVRYKQLEDAINKDKANKVATVQEEIEFLRSVYDDATKLITLNEQGEIPLRVTHNDTKCNNVCFDKDTLESLAVLDLDTVMPGLVAYDFGDAIRFIANNSAEDEVDTSKTYLDLSKYEAFCKGFISEIKDSLTEMEIKMMHHGVFAVTIELATRFLADYINGNVYFKTCYPEHNLVRARCQIALAKDVLKKQDKLKEIVLKYI